MDNDSLLQAEILKRLDILIKLMLDNRSDGLKEKSVKSQVEVLWKLNMRPSTIANILAIETSNVTAYIAQFKKKGKKQ